MGDGRTLPRLAGTRRVGREDVRVSRKPREEHLRPDRDDEGTELAHLRPGSTAVRLSLVTRRPKGLGEHLGVSSWLLEMLCLPASPAGEEKELRAALA